MSKVVDDFKAGTLDPLALDWSLLTEAEQTELLALMKAANDLAVANRVPPKELKPSGRGVGKAIKYLAVTGLSVAVLVAVYTLVF